MDKYKIDLPFIAEELVNKEEENSAFLQFITLQPGAALDDIVHALNREVSAAINCTACGNCCSTLVVNITRQEIDGLAVYLDMPVAAVKEQYIEESLAGACFINSVPCHFFADKKCTIYEGRFTECRDFPHLHKPGFKERLPGTMLHYGSCPIIYNVVEELKLKLGFRE